MLGAIFKVIYAIVVGTILIAIFCAVTLFIHFGWYVRADQRETLWQRLTARQARRDFQQREYAAGRGPAPIEPGLSTAEQMQLSALNKWATAREAQSPAGHRA